MSETVSNTSKSKRIASNSLMLFGRMLAITVINLYAVRLLLHALGQDDYGTFNAVAGVVMASSFITVTLAAALQRFYSYALGEGKSEKLTTIFSAGMNIIAVLSLVIFILFETVGLWFVNTQMDIAPERLEAANWVFQFSLGTLLLGLLQLPFTAAIFANEEMGLFALISLTECLLRLGVVILIGMSGTDGLIFYSGGLFVVAVLIFAFYALSASYRYAECRYRRGVERGLYKSLLSFSGWTLYSALAGVGLTQGITILLYIFFGPVATAAYAIASQVLHAFTALSNSVAMAFRPPMVKAYAERSYDFLNKMFAANNKFILYLLLMVAIPIILELRTIFGWWLGDVTEETVVFTRLIIVYMVCFSMHNPVSAIVQSTGRVKYYSLCVDSILLMIVPATWLAFQLGASSDASVVLMIGFCLVAHLTRLVILHRLYPQFRYRPYLTGVVLPGLVCASITALAAGLVHYSLDSGIVRLIAVFAVSAAVMLLAVYVFGLSKVERRMMSGFLSSSLRRQK